MRFDSVCHYKLDPPRGDTKYDDTKGGYSILWFDYLPKVPTYRPDEVHKMEGPRALIAQRVFDPSTRNMTRKEFQNLLSKNTDRRYYPAYEGSLGRRIEEVAEELLAQPGGTPAENSPEWERILATPTDAEWDLYIKECTKKREEALLDAKIKAIRVSHNFCKDHTVAQLATYYDNAPDPMIWSAITVLGPHLKIQKAMEYANDLHLKKGFAPRTFAPCFCDECLHWQTVRWYHECKDPHCCPHCSPF
jgi:hypothetical protein